MFLLFSITIGLVQATPTILAEHLLAPTTISNFHLTLLKTQDLSTEHFLCVKSHISITIGWMVIQSIVQATPTILAEHLLAPTPLSCHLTLTKTRDL